MYFFSDKILISSKLLSLASEGAMPGHTFLFQSYMSTFACSQTVYFGLFFFFNRNFFESEEFGNLTGKSELIHQE